MVWQIPAMWGRAPVANLGFLVARAKEVQQQLRSAEAQVQTFKEILASIEETADAAGLGTQLAEALAPPKEVEPIPHTRVLALKPYRATFRGRYGSEEFSGAAGSINDIPTVLVATLRGRVAPAPPGSELRGIPLEPWMATDGD